MEGSPHRWSSSRNHRRYRLIFHLYPWKQNHNPLLRKRMESLISSRTSITSSSRGSISMTSASWPTTSSTSSPRFTSHRASSAGTRAPATHPIWSLACSRLRSFSGGTGLCAARMY